MGLSVLGLSRFQFAMTTIFHFFYVPLSIGLALGVAILETMYVVKKKEIYLQMTKFWGKIFLLSFAVGTVTGIIQEFQFGMNWSNYSRFMGDIFGAPLAIEALLAFFLESTFLGVWMFTWNRFKPVVHAVFIWLVWLGSTLSAIWILAANAFMQHPTGFEINTETGHVRMTSFWAVISNPQLWKEFPHVFFGAVLTGGMVILGMGAWGLLREHKLSKTAEPSKQGNDKAAKATAVDAPSEVVAAQSAVALAVSVAEQNSQAPTSKREFFTQSVRFGAVIALIGAVLVIAAGDMQTQFLIEDQPMKFAATEGLYEDTEDPAPWAVVSLINENDKTSNGIEIPYMLSLLSYHKLSGSVKGMNSVNAELHEKYDAKFGKDMNYYVPVNVLFWSFRFMSLVGMAAAFVSILALWFTRKSKDTLYASDWKLWILGICTFLPFVGNSGGWLITEMGRYPWLVYGLQTIADGVSPTSTVGGLLFTNIVFFLLFLCIGGVMVFYSRRTLHQGPDLAGEGMEDAPAVPVTSAHREATGAMAGKEGLSGRKVALA